MLKLLTKIWLYFRAMFNFLYFSFLGLKHNGKYLSEKSSFIVSLTTYGERVNFIHLTLRSILLQSTPPKKIYLWLSLNNFPNKKIPKSLATLEKYGVTIRFVKEDLKSYKKIVYTYEIEKHNNDCYIVTADDDVYYPKSWLHDMELKVKENNNFVYCYRAQEISFKTEHQVCKYNQWKLYNSAREAHSVLPTGVSGICYPMYSLVGVTNKLYLDVCPTADDVWLRFITLKNGYKCKLVLNHSVHFVPVVLPFSLPEKGLEKHNVLNDLNSLSFNNCLKFFHLSKKDFQV